MIYHVAERADWLAAGDSYQTSTRGVSLAEQGFIHCSARHQVLGVLQAFYADADDLVLLEIDPAGLPVHWEPALPGGEDFPHVYGPIPARSVTAVHDLHRGPDGEWQF